MDSWERTLKNIEKVWSLERTGAEEIEEEVGEMEEFDNLLRGFEKERTDGDIFREVGEMEENVVLMGGFEKEVEQAKKRKRTRECMETDEIDERKVNGKVGKLEDFGFREKLKLKNASITSQDVILELTHF